MTLRKLWAFIAMLAVLFTIAPAPEAKAAPFVPTPRNIFNVPQGVNGTISQQYGFTNFVQATLKVMPPGSVARISALEVNLDSIANAIIDATQPCSRGEKLGCGVIVKVIFDKGQVPQEIRLMKALGTNVKANRSYAFACKASCSSTVGFMHAKIFTASSTGNPRTASKITAIGSANYSPTNHYLNWNETQVVTDPNIYAGFAKAFDNMRLDSDKATGTSFASKDGKFRGYFFPTSPATDIHLQALKSVKCTGNARGYGNASGKTVIRITIFYMTDARMKVIDQLVALKKKGCDVGFQYVLKPGSDSISQNILNKLWANKIPLYNTRKDLSGDGSPDIYAHSKFMIINGQVFGKSRKVVWNGSANYTGWALSRTNEAILRTIDNYTYDQFNKRWEQIKRYSDLAKTRPSMALPVSKSRQAPDANKRETYDPDFDIIDRTGE